MTAITVPVFAPYSMLVRCDPRAYVSCFAGTRGSSLLRRVSKSYCSSPKSPHLPVSLTFALVSTRSAVSGTRSIAVLNDGDAQVETTERDGTHHSISGTGGECMSCCLRDHGGAIPKNVNAVVATFKPKCIISFELVIRGFQVRNQFQNGMQSLCEVVSVDIAGASGYSGSDVDNATQGRLATETQQRPKGRKV